MAHVVSQLHAVMLTSPTSKVWISWFSAANFNMDFDYRRCFMLQILAPNCKRSIEHNIKNSSSGRAFWNWFSSRTTPANLYDAVCNKH
jgi:hypothetical protein